MKFKCIYCKYNTNIKCNFQKHLESFKHRKNVKKKLKKDYPNPGGDYPNPGGDYPNHKKTLKKYICLDCKCNYSTKSNLNRHRKQCIPLLKKNNRLYIEKMLELQQKLIEANKEIDILKGKNEKLNVNNEHLQEIKAIYKKNTKSVQQIIINNYNEAPNFTGLPIENMTEDKFNKYIGMGLSKGIVKMIEDNYVNDVPNEERSLWCLDQSRIKYLVRKDNSWKVDLMGREIKKAILPPIKKMLSTKLFKADENNYGQMMNCMNLVTDIEDTKTQDKILKDATSLFLHKK